MNALEEKLRGYLDGQKDIATAFLFGSQVTGSVHPGSDVDVALLYLKNRVPSHEDRLQIQDDMTRLLGRAADVVILNNASPIIRMQVLRKGEKILERDKQLFNEFFVRTIMEYDDLKRVRSVIEKNITRGRVYG